MKKHNFYFLGECAIVLALLVLIGVLIRDEKHIVQGREGVTAVVEVSEKETDDSAFLQELLKEQGTVTETEGAQETEAMSEEALANEANNAAVAAQTGNTEENVVPANTVSENSATVEEDEVKIVVFGDSIWNAGRGTDGISEQVMEQLDVEIYNCAIGGTTAAVPEGESTYHHEWTSRSFNGMMYIANDVISASQLIPNDAAYEVIKNVDFDEVDYVIVSYGLNDYFSDISVYPKEYFDLTSYVGALRHGIHKLQKNYPQLEVILTSPTYCGWFKGERQYELGTYVEAARSVAQEMDLHFLDMYHALGKNPDEKTEYLSDGVHLTKEGRTLYAHSVVEYLKTLGVE